MFPGRRRLVGLLALAAGGALFAVAWAPSEPIGPAGYRRVRAGMTRAEVRAAVGLTPGDHRLFPASKQACQALRTWGDDPEAQAVAGSPDCWLGDRFILVVAYGADGGAVGGRLEEFVDYQRPDSGPPLRDWLDRLRVRLGL